MRTLKDAVESKLDDAMSALDEIARDIPEGAYVTICETQTVNSSISCD
jgi:hypothetical protein